VFLAQRVTIDVRLTLNDGPHRGREAITGRKQETIIRVKRGKVKLSLKQAVEAHKIVRRRRGSHIL
jgi:hypothetical protein